MKKIIVAVITICVLTSAIWGAGTQQAARVDEPVQLTWLAGVWANQVDPEGHFPAAVMDALGIDLTVNIMPAAQLGQRAQVLIAGGDYPEILMLHRGPDALYKQWAGQGLFVQLDDRWNDYPGLVDAFPEEETLTPCRVNGDLYMVPVLLPSNRFGLMYRQDWLDRVGLSVPDTIDEFYDVLRAFTYGDPNASGSRNTYGMGISRDGGVGTTIVLNAHGIPGSPTAWHLSDDGSVAPNFLHPNFTTALTFLKDIYEEGLIDPDSVTKIFAEISRDFEAGRTGIQTRQIWLGPTVEATLKQLREDAEITYGPPILAPDGSRTWDFYSAAWRGNVITQRADSEAKIDAALRLFEWMVTDGEEVTFFGPEGVYWTQRNQAGVPLLEGAGLEAWGRSGHGYSEYQLMLRRFAPEPLVGSEVWVDTAATEQYLEVYDLYEPYGMLDPTIGITTPVMSELGTSLSDMILAGLFDVVIAGSPVSHFETVVAEWRRRGGEQLITEVNEEYRAR